MKLKSQISFLLTIGLCFSYAQGWNNKFTNLTDNEVKFYPAYPAFGCKSHAYTVAKGATKIEAAGGCKITEVRAAVKTPEGDVWARPWNGSHEGGKEFLVVPTGLDYVVTDREHCDPSKNKKLVLSNSTNKSVQVHVTYDWNRKNQNNPSELSACPSQDFVMPGGTTKTLFTWGCAVIEVSGGVKYIFDYMRDYRDLTPAEVWIPFRKPWSGVYTGNAHINFNEIEQQPITLADAPSGDDPRWRTNGREWVNSKHIGVDFHKDD